MNYSKNILLIAYTFPPSPGIGGRRWAKFSKYLVKEGYEVYVICANQKATKKSEWLSDINSPNIHVYERNVRFPRVLTDYPESLWAKVLYRIWILIMRIISNGRIFDRAFFWKSDLISFSEELIKEKEIKNVICTIPPYRLAYYSALLKKRNPQINFILDFRDPWTDNQTFHEFKDLSARRKKAELKMELFSIAQADYVISTTRQMTDWAKLKTKLPQKCITITNGYDVDDVLINKNSKENNGCKVILFAGNLYPGLEYVFKPFLQIIKSLEERDPNFNKKICFKFYGNISENLNVLCKEVNLKSILLNGFVPIEEIREQYINSEVFMMFSVADHSYAFNTKFFEYISYRKPIIHFSNDGDVSTFLEDNKIGVGITPENITEKFDLVLRIIQEGLFEFNSEFNSDSFSVENITKKIIPLLK